MAMIGGMKIKSVRPHINAFPDRHGKFRIYLRLPGQKSIELPGPFNSTAMIDAYEAAVAGRPLPIPAQAIAASRTKSGSLDDAIVAFYDGCAEFKKLGHASQKRHREKLEKFRQHVTKDGTTRGARPVNQLTFERIEKILGTIETPHGRRHLMNALRPLMKFCKKTNRIDIDPTLGITVTTPKTDGFKPWEESHAEQFRAVYPLGTVERLAMELILATGLRGCDAVRLGRAHLKVGADGVRRHVIKPSKTEARTNMEVKIKVHPRLQEALDAMPPRVAKPGKVTPLNYLLTKEGKPFTAGYFQQWFGAACAAVGADFDVRAHGLRKLICINLVHLGLTAAEIGAVIGDKDLRVIQRYCEKYDRERAADKAMTALEQRAVAR